MSTNPLQLARKYPKQAEAILTLINSTQDRARLRDLLGSCTCTSETLGCTCPPEYSTPKEVSYSGHAPELG